MIENIDIGGPSMIRSAAKNYKRCSCNSRCKWLFYDNRKLKNNSLTLEDRKRLAKPSITGRYDALISSYFAEKFKRWIPRNIKQLSKRTNIKIWENPHQGGVLYSQPNAKSN